MQTMPCEYCNSQVHIWFDCPKKPAGWKPERLRKKSSGGSSAVERSPSKAKVEGSTPSPRSKRSTAAGKDRQKLGGSTTSGNGMKKQSADPGDARVTDGLGGASKPAEIGRSDPAGTQAPPVDTSKPKRKDTRKGDRHKPGYWAEYLRARRARLKPST